MQIQMTHGSRRAMPKRHISALIVALVVASAHVASGQTLLSYPLSQLTGQQADHPPGQLIGVPVYDPEAKRYFALMPSEFSKTNSWMWDSVARQAQNLVYNGIHGRLAIVDTVQVHSFLLGTFKPNHYQSVWIGLRYLCQAKQLEWSDGRLWKPGSFQDWDAQWNQDVFTCIKHGDPKDWAPVAYTPEMHSWVAKGNTKGYAWYFVEFPTGAP
jgi:hypothetical protein